MWLKDELIRWSEVKVSAPAVDIRGSLKCNKHKDA